MPDRAADILSRVSRASGRFTIRKGLAASDFRSIETRFAVSFPPDLKELLSWGVPVGDRWPNWALAVGRDRAAKEEATCIDAWLARPLKGMLFDIEHHVFWDPEWGPRPQVLIEACDLATNAVAAAPKLIPVYSHRFLPCEPIQAGNPVLSVHQMDIIVYGATLDEYFSNEFGDGQFKVSDSQTVRCWSRWSRLGR